MATAVHMTRRIDVDDATVQDAKSVATAEDKQFQLVLKATDASLHELPRSVERLLHQALGSLATTGSVRIERSPMNSRRQPQPNFLMCRDPR